MHNKLLIIDTEEFDRTIMKKIFKGKYKLLFAHNEDACKKACHECMPDVVLYELRKPDEERLRVVCESIKRVGPDIPLIVIASYNTIELERYARIQGVFYYLIRPFNLKDLWDVLETAFSKVTRYTPDYSLKTS